MNHDGEDAGAGGRHGTRGFGNLNLDLWRVVRSNLFLFIVLPALVWFPIILFAEYFAPVMGGEVLSEERAYSWITRAGEILVGAWLAAVLFNGVRRLAEGSPVTAGGAILAGTRHYGRYLKTTWSYSWRIGLATLLFVIPGVVLSVWYALAIPVTTFEERSGGDAVRASRQLLRGRSWQMFWYSLGFILVYLPWVITAAWLLPVTETPLFNALRIAPFGIVAAFWSIWLALMYADATGTLELVPPVRAEDAPIINGNVRRDARKGRKRVAVTMLLGVVLMVLVYLRLPSGPMFEGSRIIFGDSQEHEIYYDKDVTSEEAWLLGDALVNLGWFEEDVPLVVRLGRDPSKYWLYIPVDRDLLSDEELMESFRWMEGVLLEIMEKPTRIVLLVASLDEWEEIPVNPAWHPPEGWDEQPARTVTTWAGSEAAAISDPVLDSANANRELARWVAEWTGVCGAFYPWSFDFTGVREHRLDPQKGQEITRLAEGDELDVLRSTFEWSPSEEFALNMFVHNLDRSGSAWSPHRQEPDRWLYFFRVIEAKGWPVMVVGPSTLLHSIGWTGERTSVVLGIGPTDSLDCLYIWRVQVGDSIVRVETHRGPHVTPSQREELTRRWPAWVRSHYSEVEWMVDFR